MNSHKIAFAHVVPLEMNFPKRTWNKEKRRKNFRAKNRCRIKRKICCFRLSWFCESFFYEKLLDVITNWAQSSAKVIISSLIFMWLHSLPLFILHFQLISTFLAIKQRESVQLADGGGRWVCWSFSIPVTARIRTRKTSPSAIVVESFFAVARHWKFLLLACSLLPISERKLNIKAWHKEKRLN